MILFMISKLNKNPHPLGGVEVRFLLVTIIRVKPMMYSERRHCRSFRYQNLLLGLYLIGIGLSSCTARYMVVRYLTLSEKERGLTLALL